MVEVVAVVLEPPPVVVLLLLLLGVEVVEGEKAEAARTEAARGDEPPRPIERLEELQLLLLEVLVEAFEQMELGTEEAVDVDEEADAAAAAAATAAATAATQ